MLALTACNNDAVLEENTSANLPKEIALQAIATPATRAAVNGTDFPTDLTIKVAAFDATKGVDYFASTDFTYANSQWTGGRYWPFSDAVINFLAYAAYDNVTGSFNGTHPANSVSLVMADNSTAQSDLMYATGTGTVTSGNTIEFPTNVPMTFLHAQSWIQFAIKAGNSSAISTITVDSITLNQVSCSGTFGVTYTNYNAAAAASVTTEWSGYASGKDDFGVIRSGSTTLTDSYAEFGNLLVVPDQGTTGFTIHYTFDGKPYDYTYTLAPATTGALTKGTKYIFNISLSVHEIIVAPQVQAWSESSEEITL
jgi:hypothetical protein